MRCDNFPDCGHVTRPGCLTARAIRAGDESASFTADELAVLEGWRRMEDRAHRLQELCTLVAHEIMAALRLLDVSLTIEPTWEGKPVINMEMSAVEAARAVIRSMPPQSLPQYRARRLLGLALSASHVTLARQANATAIQALQSIYSQARKIRQELRTQ